MALDRHSTISIPERVLGDDHPARYTAEIVLLQNSRVSFFILDTFFLVIQPKSALKTPKSTGGFR